MICSHKYQHVHPIGRPSKNERHLQNNQVLADTVPPSGREGMNTGFNVRDAFGAETSLFVHDPPLGSKEIGVPVVFVVVYVEPSCSPHTETLRKKFPV